MKKLLFLFSICFILFSCSSDDNSSEKEPSLENTLWEKIEDGSKTALAFNKSSCVLTLTVYNDDIEMSKSADYDYFYTHPEVTVIPRKSGDATLKGIVNNNKMTVTNTSTNKEIGVFIKK